MRELLSLSGCNWTRAQNLLILKLIINHLTKLTKGLNFVLSTYLCTVYLTVCSCHVTYAFQSESTLYSRLNVSDLLARSRYKI